MSTTTDMARALAPVFREALDGNATVRRRGEILTITAPASGSMHVTAHINPDTPEEPKRDARGRFRKRLGVVAVTGERVVEWEVR